MDKTALAQFMYHPNNNDTNADNDDDGTTTSTTKKRRRSTTKPVVQSKFFGSGKASVVGSGPYTDLAQPDVFQHLTPLERQVVKWKQQYPGVCLFIQIGHRFRLFGPEAIIVAKLRGYKDFKLKHFRLCSFPVYFADRAIAAAVKAGLRVGVISQRENAPIKHLQRNTDETPDRGNEYDAKEAQLFNRKIGPIYTTATYSVHSEDSADDPLVLVLYESVVEPGVGQTANQILYPKEVTLTVVLLNAKTGAIRYHNWKETADSRHYLLSLLENTCPGEVLLPDVSEDATQCLSFPTVRTLAAYASFRQARLKVPPLLAGYGLYGQKWNSANSKVLTELKTALASITYDLSIAREGSDLLERMGDLSYYGLWLLREHNIQSSDVDTDGWQREYFAAPVFSGDETDRHGSDGDGPHECTRTAVEAVDDTLLSIEWLPRHYFTKTSSEKATACLHLLPRSSPEREELKCALEGLIQYYVTCNCDTRFLKDTITPLNPFKSSMNLSARTITDLELTRAESTKTKKGSLLNLVSSQVYSRTGYRILRQWVENPLTDANDLMQRLDAVEHFIDHSETTPCAAITNILRQLTGFDFQRKFQLLKTGLMVPSKCCLFLFAIFKLGSVINEGEMISRVPKLFQEYVVRTHASELIPVVRSALMQVYVFSKFKEHHSDEKIDKLISFLKHWERPKSVFENSLTTSYGQWEANESPINVFIRSVEETKYPKIVKCKERIIQIHNQLEAELEAIRKDLGRPELTYREPLQLANGTTEEYLIELEKSDPLVRRFLVLDCVEETMHAQPAISSDWHVISETKRVIRLRSPAIERMVNREKGCLALARAYLEIAYCDAWKDWQQDIAAGIQEYFRGLIQLVGLIDATQSLSHLSASSNYCRPTIVQSDCSAGIWAKDARHPLMESFGSYYQDCRLTRTAANSFHSLANVANSNVFVPNDVSIGATNSPQLQEVVPKALRDSCCRTMVLSGPNMGGKSTYCRMVSLLVVMAQIGCFVPASECVISCFDSISTNIGLYTENISNSSSFTTEMSQLSSIISNATERTLLILDELGRRTSAREGSAIGQATLDYLHGNIKCCTVCTTHLSQLVDWASHRQDVKNASMAATSDDRSFPTFLFKLQHRGADKSYGLQVARSAGVPAGVISKATNYLKYLDIPKGSAVSQ